MNTPVQAVASQIPKGNPTVAIGLLTVGGIFIYAGFNNLSLASVLGMTTGGQSKSGSGKTVADVTAGSGDLSSGGFNTNGIFSNLGGVIDQTSNVATPADVARLSRAHPELKAGVRNAVAKILHAWPKLQITSTTGGTHAQGSYHYQGRAVDLAADAAYMQRAALWIEQHMWAQLTEGIHNPGLSVKYRVKVPSTFWGAGTWAGHANHIHIAV